MGRGFNKAKNKLKMQNLKCCWKEIERLQAENKALKEDPTSVVGQFINEFNEVIGQNQRLSALTCAMITKHGVMGPKEKLQVKITRDEIEVYRGKRLQVKIETNDDNIKFEDATEYFFSFEALEKEPEAPANMTPPCKDENCPLPKEPMHYHTPQGILVATPEGRAVPMQEPLECHDPNCTLPKDFKHSHTTPVDAPPAEEASAAAPADQVENTVNQVENSPAPEAVEAS